MRRNWRIVAALVFLLTLVVGSFLGRRVLAVSDQTRDGLRLYTELINVAQASYGEEVANRDLVFSSISGMLRTLDPHTYFLTPRAYDSMREKQQSTYQGLGLLVSLRNGRLTVITPIEGTPASRLGIAAGDIIDTIDGVSTEDLSLDDSISRLKGPEGTTVDITILRRGLDEPLAMTVTRAEIPQTTVRYAYMLDDMTGYLWITDFGRGTGAEVIRAIADLREQGMERLLLDLRNNGGGLLDQAIVVSEQFLDSGAKVVETRGRTRDSFEQYTAAPAKTPTLDLPIVVLVNNGTASAAEIVSGAIQDHDRGLVVGQPTWGKGLVQTVYNLSYGAGIGLTTAKYYTPSGRLIQRNYTSFYDYYTKSLNDADANAEDGDGELKRLAPPNEPVFFTDIGREVYGGGGITPDYLVDDQLMGAFTQNLVIRNAFVDFANDLVHRTEIKSQEWRPSQATLDEFRAWLTEEEIAEAEVIEEGFAEEGAQEDFTRRIRAEVMNSVFSYEDAHRARAEGDLQIQEALALFDRAQELLAQRKVIKDAEATAVAAK